MEGEVILARTSGMANINRWGIDFSNATLLATDRRVLIHVKRLGGYTTEELAYSTITGVEVKRTMAMGRLTIRAAASSIELKMVLPDEAEAVARAIREQMNPSRTPTGPTPRNVAQELRELAQLRDDGIITGEDFETAKQNLLGG